jgi:cysteine/O-acetylserine efflux protein
VLRYVGAGYILYLAYGILKASYDFTAQKDVKPLGFVRGFLLQILNPKLYVYAFTLFSAFLASITTNIALLGVAAFLLAIISFGATSVWALFGAAIKTYLQYSHVKTVVNILLALFLVYTAIELAGIF